MVVQVLTHFVTQTHKHFIIGLHNYSRFTWIILCKSKFKVTILFQKFILMIEIQYNYKVKIVRTNSGPEFSMSDFYSSKGIDHQTSCVKTSPLPQNGRVERKHQCILNVGRTLLFHSKLPKQFLSYAVLHATYLINRIPNPLLKTKLSFFHRFDSNPDIDELKSFGSLCYASTLQNHRTKLDSRGRKIFLRIQAKCQRYCNPRPKYQSHNHI